MDNVGFALAAGGLTAIPTVVASTTLSTGSRADRRRLFMVPPQLFSAFQKVHCGRTAEYAHNGKTLRRLTCRLTGRLRHSFVKKLTFRAERLRRPSERVKHQRNPGGMRTASTGPELDLDRTPAC